MAFTFNISAGKLTKSLTPAEPPPPPNPFNTTMKTALSYTAGMGTINALGVGRYGHIFSIGSPSVFPFYIFKG